MLSSSSLSLSFLFLSFVSFPLLIAPSLSCSLYIILTLIIYLLLSTLHSVFFFPFLAYIFSFSLFCSLLFPVFSVFASFLSLFSFSTSFLPLLPSFSIAYCVSFHSLLLLSTSFFFSFSVLSISFLNVPKD